MLSSLRFAAVVRLHLPSGTHLQRELQLLCARDRCWRPPAAPQSAAGPSANGRPWPLLKDTSKGVHNPNHNLRPITQGAGAQFHVSARLVREALQHAR